MSFNDIKSAIAAEAGLPKAAVGETMAAFIAYLQAALQNGEKVNLPGLGQFEVTERSAREGRNPRTGETISLPASKGVKFKAAKALKDAVNG